MLQNDFHKMSTWSENWLLKFHPDKLKKLTITNKKICGGENILCTCEKDLGVHIDNYLNFDVRRKEKIQEATRMMGVIRRTFKFLNCNMFNLLYVNG